MHRTCATAHAVLGCQWEGYTMKIGSAGAVRALTAHVIPAPDASFSRGARGVGLAGRGAGIDAAVIGHRSTLFPLQTNG